MLNGREREAAAEAASRWPKSKADLFIRQYAYCGKPIRSEQAAIKCIYKRPDALQMAAPEVRLACQRGQISPTGIEQAFRDLIAFCQSKGQNYMDLLDNNPAYLADLLLQGVRQGDLFGV